MTPGTVSVGFLHPGRYSACFADSLEAMLFHDATHNKRIVSHPHGKISLQVGSGGIVSGRNAVTKSFLDNSDGEWLFWIDSDMGFTEDTVDRLVDSADPQERPVVGGLAFALKQDGTKPMGGIRYKAVPTLYSYVEVDGEVGFTPRFNYPRDEVVEVSATGGAIVLIHRTVLERIRGEFGDVWYEPAHHPSGVQFSEDLSFCVRVAALDLPMFVHTGVKTTHDKDGVFLDEEFFDLQQERQRIVKERECLQLQA